MYLEQTDFHDHLMRGLTHKMNNILSLFHGYLGLLMDDKKLDHATRDGLSRIREGADEASALMNRTRAFTKSSASGWREITPAAFLRQLTPTFESLCERGVSIHVTCREDLPALWVEPSRLRSALIEIVGNACDASSDSGAVKVAARCESRVAAEAGAGEDDWLVITISDEGEGVPPALANDIFRPFFTTKKATRALGLGLSVATEMMNQLGGTIRYESMPGHTAFSVSVPLRTASPYKS